MNIARTHSLRLRLIAGSLAAILLVFIAAGLLLYALLRSALLAEFDATLDSQAHALASMTEQGQSGIKLDLEAGQMPEFAKGSTTGFFLLKEQGKAAVARSESLEGRDWTIDPEERDHPASHEFIRLPGNRPGRWVRLEFVPRVEEDEAKNGVNRRALLFVARDATLLHAKLLQLAASVAGVFSVAWLLAAAAMTWIVARALQPLRTVAERIRAIGIDDLSERVSAEQSPTEMHMVVDRINELLAKVQAGFSRERAFTADVAHELRTPLAGVMTALQVTLNQRRSPEEYEDLLRKCLAASGDMRAMVENLLTLARVDAHQVDPHWELVHIDELLQTEWPRFQSRAAERNLQVSFPTTGDVTARTDRCLLAMVVRNLMDNAVAYCSAGGTVEFQCVSDHKHCVLRVANSGSTVAAQDAQHVTDRFWRGDRAHRISARCGLGLALCKRIVELLGGKIHVHTQAGGMFVVEVALPPESQPDRPVPLYTTLPPEII